MFTCVLRRHKWRCFWRQWKYQCCICLKDSVNRVIQTSGAAWRKQTLGEKVEELCNKSVRENVEESSYVLHGHTVENVSSAKYLGVTINNTVSWVDHISNTCSKANRALGFLRRNLKISASNINEKAYKVFVRPLLEYAASVWDPCSQKRHCQDRISPEASGTLRPQPV